MRAVFAASLVVLAGAFGQAPPAGQPRQPAPSGDLVLRISVALVQVDAVVTDRDGRHVADLKAGDFEILQDGKPQKITRFSYVRTGPEATPAAAPRPAHDAAPPPPRRLRADQVRRTVALVVDDLGLSFESTVRVREAIRKFVDEQMQPGDLVAVIRTAAGMGALQQFTAEKRQLYAAIERVRFNPFGRTGIGSFKPLGTEPSGMPETHADELWRQAETRLDEFQEQVFSVGTLGAINYVVQGLRELPGRKSVVLFSENMRIMQTEGANSQILDALQRLTDAANRASVVIYSIDPRGLQSLGLTAEDRFTGTTPELDTALMKRRQDHFDSQEGLFYLAHETGGLFIDNNNDINQGIRRVLEDQAGYYLIGYRPDPSTWDPDTGRRKFHSVRVRVKRPGLRVRSRNGFFGVPEQRRAPAQLSRLEKMAAALTSPFGAGGMRLKLTSLFSSSPKQGSYIRSLLHIDARDLQFSDEPGGWHKAVADVLVITFGDNGQEVDRSDRTFTMRMRGEAYKTALANGFLYSINHPVKRPGAYQLRVAVRDGATGGVGSASQFIEVPDVKKARLALSGIVLRAWVPQAAQTSDGAEGRVEEPDPAASPGVRIFKPGAELTYGFQVINARIDPGTKRPDVSSQLRIYRDGAQVFAGKVARLAALDLQDTRHILTAGRVRLGSRMAPGEYIAHVVVTDNLAKEKYRTATQWIDFEVKP